MIDILYEDSGLLTVIKPTGVLSQETAGAVSGMVTLLREQTGSEIFPVHRLDRDTAGVMVYAKTKAAAAALSGAIQRGELKKSYLAVVRGCPAEREGTMEDLLLHDKSRNKSFVVARQRGGVKRAALRYRLLACGDGLSLVGVALETGRTHQIRVQFASRKMPLAGDRKYGGGSGTMALWSVELQLPHPETGKPLVFRQLPKGPPWEDLDFVRAFLRQCDDTPIPQI